MNKREQYDRHLHATRLVKFFKRVERGDISWHCPASIGFEASKRFIFEDKINIHEDPVNAPECRTCKKFIGMDPDLEACPCDHFGNEEAIELTEKKLREEGYLE